MIANYYSTPELAAHYDEDCEGRTDFPFYLALAQTLQAQRIIDIGCGTGLLCSQLAAQGHSLLGLEPQATMLDLARAQPSASAARWIHGTADDLPNGWADLVLMTGHVAQYFLDDDAWHHVLAEVHRSLRPDGHLAFEIRNDTVEEWRAWSTEAPKVMPAGTLRQEVRRDGDLITHTDHWVQDGRNWTTTETLRFPSWPTVTRGLAQAGFMIANSWGDFDGQPIRPESPEWIILARQN
jgi:SAM-dependent methyltransferase